MAVGCVGMSYEDFVRLTPGELEVVFRAYKERRKADYRDSWERMRQLAVMTMQPHCKSRLSGRRILPFPWEREERRRPSADIPDKRTAREVFEAMRRIHPD